MDLFGMASQTRKTEITQLLQEFRNGDRTAFDRLVPLVEPELRRLAKRSMDGERADHTLQTTALINEAFIRLLGCRSIEWQNRGHFFHIAGMLMRRILVDYARRLKAGKRGGKSTLFQLDESYDRPPGRTLDRDELLALHEALEKLEKLDERLGRVVILKFFSGLANREIAEITRTSLATVKRDWETARAWLYQALEGK